MNFQDILTQQRELFNSQKTKSLNYRKIYLEKLKEVLIKNEDLLYEAIYEDFGKSKFDTFTTEISFVLKDIDYFLKNLKSLSKPKRMRTNLANQLGSSKIHSDPLGCTLVIGAWNYPYQLSLSPMVAALAAGNTCILKPSEMAENSMKAMAKIINENFPKEYLFVAEGGVEEITEILKLKFDKIFFTGSPKVGQIIYEAAAKHMTPVVLELGGKSPAIVTSSANFEVAAKRIVWGKFLNAGQTCVAPDYILVDEKVKDSFLDSLKSYIQKFNYQPGSEQYTRIINDRNFERLVKLIDNDKIFYGGKTDASIKYIEPTILQNVTWDDAVMQEEIFGPILPVLTFKNFKFTQRSSVEHFYAQQIEQGEELEEKYLHNFGNLCLISSSKNSSLGNRSPSAKRDYFRHEIKKGKIDTLKLYLMIQLLEKEGDWREAQIKKHEEGMLHLFALDYKGFCEMSVDEFI